MYGMPADMQRLLQLKYAILQQQADSGTTAANAAANLDMARAKVIPSESAANIGRTEAETAFTREQAKYFGPTALANIGLTKAQTGRTNAESTFISGAQTAEAMSRVGLNNSNRTSIDQLNREYDIDSLTSRSYADTGRGFLDAFAPRMFRLGTR